MIPWPRSWRTRTKLEPGFLHMKILVSAIACCPLFGSEVLLWLECRSALARDHELWVIINNQGKEGVQAAVAKGEVPTNIHFIYHGRSKEEFDRTFLTPWHPNRLIARLANWLNYLEWNNGLLDLARKLHAQIGFDLVHHVTYATWRVGSPLVCLGVPFVWGPIGGGEDMPLPFVPMLSAEGAAFEVLRKVSDLVSTFSRAVRRTARLSSHIFAANKETESRAVEIARPQNGRLASFTGFFSVTSRSPNSAPIPKQRVLRDLAVFCWWYVGRPEGHCFGDSRIFRIARGRCAIRIRFRRQRT